MGNLISARLLRYVEQAIGSGNEGLWCLIQKRDHAGDAHTQRDIVADRRAGMGQLEILNLRLHTGSNCDRA